MNLASNLASNHAKNRGKIEKTFARLSLVFLLIDLVVPETAFLADYF